MWFQAAVFLIMGWLLVVVVAGSSSMVLLLLALLSAMILISIHVIAKKLKLTDSLVSESTVRQYEKGVYATEKERMDDGINMSISYYDIVTDWYELAWGESFQLGAAQGFTGESLGERCRRHEYWIASHGGIKSGEKWLDLGCGVGGPMRHISRFTGASILGINLNMLQLQRAKRYIANEGLQALCSLLYCDFAKLEEKLPLDSYDGAYALEAVCHAPDKVACYKSVKKVLKPGGHYVCYEWALTSKFDAGNASHQNCKRAVETLGGVPHLNTEEEILTYLRDAGFEIIEQCDISGMTLRYPDPWYNKFDPSASIFNFPASWWGIVLMQYFLRTSEFFGIVPKGSASAHRVITSGIDGTILSGKLGIFTPHFYVKARKPIQ